MVNMDLHEGFPNYVGGRNYRMSTLVWLTGDGDADCQSEVFGQIHSVWSCTVNCSLMLRVCNLWQFRHYLFLKFSFIVFVPVLVYCQLTWWLQSTIAQWRDSNYNMINVYQKKTRQIWKSVVSSNMIKYVHSIAHIQSADFGKWCPCAFTFTYFICLFNSATKMRHVCVPARQRT